MNRRDFLKSVGLGPASAALLHSALARAAALPAIGRSGTLDDVEHVVVFMQENRSFDHYFGHLNGVRGYNDHSVLRLPNGKPAWFQPRMERPDETILPFHLDTRRTSAQLMLDLDHSWNSQHGAIAGGRNDAWPLNKTDMTMGYFLRQDIPFHYALADTFTICDHYFCSIAGPTCPNRAMLWSGSIDPEGSAGGPFIDDAVWIYTKGVEPFEWTTYPQRLQEAGVSWQVYQEGLHEIDHDPLTGNYNCNALAYFKAYAEAPAGSPLHQRAMTGGGLARLRDDVLHERLPQVSWIVAPAGYCEHPAYPPAFGAIYIARLFEALTANPKVWGKTVLLINYDENDGFFDHLVPPQPPTPVLPGRSTVSTAGEIHDVVNARRATLYEPDQLPYGLGPRVPMLAISPWSKGGYVCSEVFDHTSVLRFLEKRFAVREPNISPWRRAVCGDLTSAFDFTTYSSRRLSLPVTNRYREMVAEQSQLPPPIVPAHQRVEILAQEPGVRPARALPYALQLDLAPHHGGVRLHFNNRSRVGVCCTAHWDGSERIPRHYTVGAGHTLKDFVRTPKNQTLALTVYGPNGFLRHVHGNGPAALRVTCTGTREGKLIVHLHNGGAEPIAVRVIDQRYGRGERAITVAAGEAHDVPWELHASRNWYDVTVETRHHVWRFTGHVEDGRASTTDPANSEPVLS